MKYEEIVLQICCCDNDWRNNSEEERDSVYGVAIMMAFLDGCRPMIEDLSKSLNVEVTEMEVAFRRLQASGMFSMKFNARRDRCLNGYSSAQDGRTAWSFIAGISSGYVGQGYHIIRPGNQSSK